MQIIIYTYFHITYMFFFKIFPRYNRHIERLFFMFDDDFEKNTENRKRVRIFVQKRARASVRVCERDIEREKESGQF